MTETEGNTDQSETDSQAKVKDELSALVEEGTKQPDGIDDVVSYVREQRAEKIESTFRSDLDAAVKVVTDAVPEDARKLVDAEIIEGFLYRKADVDPVFKDAFLNRKTKPQAWERAKNDVSKEFAKRFEELPDEGINADREAVIASAKTQGKSQELEYNEEAVAKMSKAEFAELQRKVGLRPYGT